MAFGGLADPRSIGQIQGSGRQLQLLGPSPGSRCAELPGLGGTSQDLETNKTFIKPPDFETYARARIGPVKASKIVTSAV